MFDWNEEEITNIIWGEARESDDHIVPYPDDNEEKSSGSFGDQTSKRWNEETHSIKPDEQNKSSTVANFHEPKLIGRPKYEEDECPEDRLGSESGPTTSMSNSSKNAQDSKKMGASGDLAEIPEHNTFKQDSSDSSGGTSLLHVSSEIFQNQLDDEQGNFVNYGWDNIGNLDDLVNIFNNDDPIFGDASLGNVDELWSPSKDVTRSPDKYIPLSFETPSLDVDALPTLPGQLAIPSEFSLDQDIVSPVSAERTNSTSDAPKKLESCSNADEYIEGGNKPLKTENTTKEASRNTPSLKSQLNLGTMDMQNEFVDKGVQQKQLLRTGIRSKEEYEVRPLQDICATWSTSPNQLQQFDSQYAPAISQPYWPSVATQHRQLIGPQSSQCNYFLGQVFGSPMYVNMGTHYPPMVGLPGHQNTISGFRTSLDNPDALRKPSDPPTQPLPMTPQEKIEKLRRRQKMRAMLAIQKQQEQFNNQASSVETPNLEGAHSELDEAMTILPSSKPFEKDESAFGVHLGDHSVEDSILFHLQQIIGKLDIRIRLCIRDSLFRLAQSAVQRQYSSDIRSTNRSGRDEGFNKGEQYSQNRLYNMPAVEAETNRIDRTVAHLLFHRPLHSSEEHAKRPGSSSSADLSSERKADLMSLPTTQLPQDLGNELIVSHDGAKASLLFTEVNQLRKSPGLDIPETSSTDEAAAGSVFTTGTSQ